MICPQCGSIDVIDSRTQGAIDAECLHCGHLWAEPYNPWFYAKQSRLEKEKTHAVPPNPDRPRP